MFGWFRPTCPCDTESKRWVESRLRWLSAEFEDNAFNGRRIVLPTCDFFPDVYDRSKKTVHTLFERVCEYMDVNPGLVDLRFSAEAGKLWLVNGSGKYLPQAAGTYQEGERKFIVTLDSADFSAPMSLVGTMAHELAHLRLMGENRVSSQSFDNELLTDLTVVFLGLGIFLANCPRNWPGQYSKWPKTDLNKPEYMTPPMFGYALAHLAWFRGEERPTWARHLHLNSRHDFKQALRFLNQTGESTFKPLSVRIAEDT